MALGRRLGVPGSMENGYESESNEEFTTSAVTVMVSTGIFSATRTPHSSAEPPCVTTLPDYRLT
jgi:hypothetical protein